MYDEEGIFMNDFMGRIKCEEWKFFVGEVWIVVVSFDNV